MLRVMRIETPVSVLKPSYINSSIVRPNRLGYVQILYSFNVLSNSYNIAIITFVIKFRTTLKPKKSHITKVLAHKILRYWTLLLGTPV